MDFNHIDGITSDAVLYVGTDSPQSPAHLLTSSRQKVASNYLIYQKCVLDLVFSTHLGNV